MQVGFIGLGIMGSRMAANLLSSGHDLVVHNRTRDKAEALLGAGARWAATPADAVRGVEVLFTMLSTPEVVQTLATAEDGFLAAMDTGSRWVDCSTVNPEFARWMSGIAGGQGIQLIFFAGGGREDIEFVRPLLDSMGKRVLHLGGPGQGAAIKMLFNLMLGSAMVAYSEALVLGKALGLSPQTMAEVLLDAPVSAPFLKLKQPVIESGDFEAHFPLRWMRKDLQLAAQSAYEHGVALPALNVIKEVYALAEKDGRGEMDFAAVWQYLDR